MDQQEDVISRLQEAVLGETDTIIQLDSAAEFRVAVLEVVRQASHRIQIFSADLEAVCYDHEDFAAALVKVANYHPVSNVQILVRDASVAVKQGHRLASLCQRFSSSIQARRIAEDYRNRRETYLIADNKGVVYRANEDSYKGYANFHAADTASHLAREFTEVWERSGAEIEFRRLLI